MDEAQRSAPDVRVVVVDDHEMVAESFRRALAGAGGFDVVAVATTAEAGLHAVVEHRPDVALLDLALPDGDGLALAAAIRDRCPSVHTMLLTGSREDPNLLADALRAGCAGCVSKTAPFDRVVRAVRAAAAGEIAASPDDVARVLASGGRRAPDQLTSRELDVLRLMGEGLSNKDIAERLVVSVHTVRRHVQTILAKLGVHSKLEAVTKAQRTGLLRRP